MQVVINCTYLNRILQWTRLDLLPREKSLQTFEKYHVKFKLLHGNIIIIIV